MCLAPPKCIGSTWNQPGKRSSFSILRWQQSHLRWPPDDGINISVLTSLVLLLLAPWLLSIFTVGLHWFGINHGWKTREWRQLAWQTSVGRRTAPKMSDQFCNHIHARPVPAAAEPALYTNGKFGLIFWGCDLCVFQEIFVEENHCRCCVLPCQTLARLDPFC